jgi:CheY-like chemotaxis protein
MGPAILVVDDEPAICEGLAAYLEDEGMRVYRAGSGEDAVAQVAAGLPVEVCIMDLRLPGMSGTATIREMSLLAPKVRFLIHTGSPREEVADELERAGLGPAPMFQKPVSDMGEMARAALKLWHAANPATATGA